MATDGSKQANVALQTASRLLISAGRHVDLLCVGPRLRGKDEYQKRILTRVERVLDQARSGLSRYETPVNLLAEIGSPSALIVSHSDDYDLTVIGPKGRGSSGASGLGPVASRVLEHASSPVLVGRELRNEDGIRILAAVDGSVASRHAIETLGELVDLTAAEVCLMHIAETPWTEMGLEADWVTYSEEDKEQSEAGLMEKELLREGEFIVDQARLLLRPYRASVTVRFEEGNPANEILSEADRGQYDLVVAGATGSRDLKHSMLGSVSAKIAWNAPCSVLIVREPD